MKNPLLFCALALLALPNFSRADEADEEISKQEAALSQEADKPGFEAALQKRYNLTDAQIKSLRDMGMNRPQMTVTAAFADASGKTTDEIAKMRLEQKMGWGRIAKELGIPPKSIGQSISSMHNGKDQKDANKQTKLELKENRKNEREARRSEKRQNREAKKAERQENKNEKK